jgi:hypothetical protein
MDTKTFTLRIDAGTYNELDQQAKKSFRSKAKQIRYLVWKEHNENSNKPKNQ